MGEFLCELTDGDGTCSFCQECEFIQVLFHLGFCLILADHTNQYGIFLLVKKLFFVDQ